MVGFILKRLLGMVLVLFVVSILVFLLFNVVPNSDPAVRMAGKNATPAQIAAIRESWHFNDPLYVQYLYTMKKIFTGELISYSDQTNVLEQIIDGLPRTMALAIGASIIWLVAGITLGVFGAMRAGRVSDRLLAALALIGVSIPVFWLGALATNYLGYELGIFPNGGYVPIAEGGAWEWFYHLVLPWLVLSVLFIGVYSRVMRNEILQTVDDDYVRTARAKGISERQVMVRHVLRNSLIPIVTLWGLDFGAVIGGGAVLTESVFDLQGVGQYFAEAIGRLDVPPVLAVTMLAAVFIVVLNTLVDIVYAFLDPRIRAEA